ncbi:MAG: clan AA aspartic protease [Desulfomonilaceae bacterium]
MGEVRIDVELTNPMDIAMVREGFKKPEDVRRKSVKALVDTGAVNSVLPPFVADSLGLARVFRQMAQYVDGRREEVEVTEPVLMEIMGRKVFEECLVLGDEVLIGQTALEKTDLHVDCREGRVIPNPDHPNQPIVKVR